MTISAASDDSDDDLDWEEVYVPEKQQQLDVPLELELESPPAQRQNIEITIQTQPKKNDSKKEAAAALHAQRVLRTTCHKIHTVALLANARIRNKWINNSLLHARLLSITPLALQNGFAMIHKSRIPDQNKRGRLFEGAVDRLVTWWCETFFAVTPTGHIRSQTFEEVQDQITSANHPDAPESDHTGDERIRSVESLMKHVLMHRGSRDTSAQLFTALCRALDIPARLVVSLQSVPWKSGSATGARSLKSPDPTTTPPVFWTEVFSRPDSRWLPVDPIRGIVNKRHVFDPSCTHNSAGRSPTRQDNRMLYVIGLEEDGFGRDITARYAREYTAKVSKIQAVGGGNTGGRKEWWASVVQSITRPYRLQRDDLEDDELHMHQLTEGMPTTIAGFKNHPLYALARHLRRDQVIDPPTELGKFRGEPVYPRSSVISLKTAENWMRLGRVIRQGCQPMKMVKQRAMTINRQREMEVGLEKARVDGNTGGDEELMQGLYSLSQTELYTPEPIKDGKIPKNDFGNIDLYVPSMLPEGAVHIPFKGVAKIAKNFGFDYAEAVTGFEFRKRKAMPVIQGIVVAAENENVIVEAWLESEQYAEERARARRLERACKRWTRLIHGLRIRERLQKQYALVDTDKLEQTVPLERQSQQPLQRHESWLDTDENEQPGGYLTTADDVVQPFHLPRDVHRYDPTAVATTSAVHLNGDDDRIGTHCHPRLDGDVEPGVGSVFQDQSPDLADTFGANGDVAMDEVNVQRQPPKGAPMTMRELAESYARQRGDRTPSPQEEEGDLAVLDTARIQGEVMGDVPACRTAKRRASTRTTRTTKKRARRRTDENGDTSDGVDGEDTPPMRRRIEAPVTPAASTSNSTPGSGRVLRPRPQKSAARAREEREMEEAYRRAVAG